ncbi:MAG: hypothetical protein LBO65_03500 [Spirochaetaceae bacterium]|jgi:hypothetical protein|nr:hypothetical protein [Spirochaetaceae bacterium]
MTGNRFFKEGAGYGRGKGLTGNFEYGLFRLDGKEQEKRFGDDKVSCAYPEYDYSLNACRCPRSAIRNGKGVRVKAVCIGFNGALPL